MKSNLTRTDRPVEDAPTPAPADALAEFTTLRDTLTRTHTEIPALLSRERSLVHELGLAEARGDSTVADLRAQLDETVRQRQGAARRRAASTDALLAMESALQTERTIAEAERQKIVAEVAREFGARWRQACDALSTLRAEAATLGSALRTSISTPAPFTAFTHPVTGDPALRPVAASGPPPVATLPAHLAALVARLDSLDAALARVAAIRQSKVLDARFYDLGKVRQQPVEFNGVFVCTAAFDSLTDGLTFEVGTLIDASLVGPGSMHRLTLGRRYIRPAGLETATAA
jgi:hypothetical protein